MLQLYIYIHIYTYTNIYTYISLCRKREREKDGGRGGRGAILTDFPDWFLVLLVAAKKNMLNCSRVNKCSLKAIYWIRESDG